MDHITPYRNPDIIRKLSEEINNISLNRKINLMEVCGTHTMSIKRFGIESLLPEEVKLLSGPGCPVCVTPTSYIDTAIKLAEDNNNIIVTFGDMVRIPGSSSSLEKVKAEGGEVVVVYSPMEALELATKNRNKNVIFLAVGFETTSPSIAITLYEAKKTGLNNFFILEGNKLIPPAIEVILQDEGTCIDGFILPGHVCTIVGCKIFEFIPKVYGIPCAVSGFEPIDILLAIKSLIQMIATGDIGVKNTYSRAVKYEGNKKAQDIIKQVFIPADSTWRGIGTIKNSGLILNEKFSSFKILNKIDIGSINTKEPPGCICGEILKGKAYPYDCPLFGKKCTPEHPIGPCMISSEGSCAAYYKYGTYSF